MENNITWVNDSNFTYTDPFFYPRVGITLLFLLFIIVGFLGNLFLLVCLVQIHKLRSGLRPNALNILMRNVCFIHICDSAFNIPILIHNHYKSSHIPLAGRPECLANGFMTHFFSVELVFILFAFFYEVAYTFRHQHHHSVKTAFIIVGITWSVALEISVHTLSGSVPLDSTPAYFMCYLSKDTPSFYFYLTYIICYATPISLFFGGVGGFIIKRLFEKKIRRKLQKRNIPRVEIEEILNGERNKDCFFIMTYAISAMLTMPFNLDLYGQRQGDPPGSSIHNTPAMMRFSFPAVFAFIFLIHWGLSRFSSKVVETMLFIFTCPIPRVSEQETLLSHGQPTEQLCQSTESLLTDLYPSATL